MTVTRELMGTVIGINVRDAVTPADLEAGINAAFARLSAIEDVFTTYRPDSEISRLGRGELSVEECSPDLAVVLQLCDSLFALSEGAFDIYAAAVNSPAATLQAGPHARPLEPSGMVKGWAIDEAVMVLREAGFRDFSVNAGGDVFVAGSNGGAPWRVGLQHPLQRDKVMAVVTGTELAVATSGTYERGDHIVTANHETPLLSITIVGPDMTLADAYATAAFAMGERGMEWAANLLGFDVFAVDGNEMTHRSAGMDAYLVD